MDAKLQRRVQRYGWDRAVNDYERSWKDQLEPAQNCLLALASIGFGCRVLDVACGTGLVTFRAARMTGPAGRVVGVDISGEMVERARQQASIENAGHVTFERCGAEELPMPDGSFDVVLSALGLMYVPDPERALREMYRTLREGGTAAAAVWGRRANCGWAAIFSIVDARVQSEVCPLFFHLGTGESLGKAFARAGFAQIRTERINTTLRYPNAEAALAAAFSGGPVALAYSRFDEQTRHGAHAEYLDSIAEFRSGHGLYEIPGEFVIAAGLKPGP